MMRQSQREPVGSRGTPEYIHGATVREERVSARGKGGASRPRPDFPVAGLQPGAWTGFASPRGHRGAGAPGNEPAAVPQTKNDAPGELDTAGCDLLIGQLGALPQSAQARQAMDELERLVLAGRADLLKSVRSLDTRRMAALTRIALLRQTVDARAASGEGMVQAMRDQVQRALEAWGDLEREYTELMCEAMWQDMGGEG